MSCLHRGKIVQSEMTARAMGGTELMRGRVKEHVDPELLDKVAIHFSRPRTIYSDCLNILYLHDLATDPENEIFENGEWELFDHFVFVSYWQRAQYQLAFPQVPFSKQSVILNAIEEPSQQIKRSDELTRFIYHTTPHRGLDVAVAAFDRLITEGCEDIHFDVYSSFSVYGWEQRDQQFANLFDFIRAHPNMTYHGGVPREQVMNALAESDFFLYPSTWQETSCLAMIEAMALECVPIHSDLAALPETALRGCTVMYDYTEDKSAHVDKVVEICKTILHLKKIGCPTFNFKNPNQYQHRIPAFKKRWEDLIRKLVDKS